MTAIVRALAGPVVIALVLVVAIAIDRWREPRRDPAAPFVVVDRRTYRYGQHRVARLLTAGDTWHARAVLTSMAVWLRTEVRTGPARRRVRYAADLEQVELRLVQLPPRPHI